MQQFFGKMSLGTLPPELLSNILLFLAFDGIKAISTVSKSFYAMTDDPLLWKSFQIASESPTKLNNALSLYTLHKLQSLHLCALNTENICDEDIREMFVNIYVQRFEYPEINDSDLRCVDPQTISKVFRDARNLQLCYSTHLCPHQTQSLFISLPNSWAQLS